MFAASSTFEVAELVNLEVRHIQRHSFLIEGKRFLLHCFVRVKGAVLDGWVARQAHVVAKQYTSQAVWFAGARDGIERGKLCVREDRHLEFLARLEKLSLWLEGVEADTLKCLRKLDEGGRGLKSARALQRVADAVGSELGEVRGLVATVLAHTQASQVLDSVKALQIFSQSDEVVAKLAIVSASTDALISRMDSPISTEDWYDEELLAEARLTVEAGRRTED